MPDTLVHYDIDDKVSIITLNRPEKLNAISAELQRAVDRGVRARRRRSGEPASSCCVPRAAASAPATTSRRRSRARMIGAATRPRRMRICTRSSISR